MNRQWFYCPVCGQKLAKTDERANGGVFLKCKKCKQDVEIIHQGLMNSGNPELDKKI